MQPAARDILRSGTVRAMLTKFTTSRKNDQWKGIQAVCPAEMRHEYYRTDEGHYREIKYMRDGIKIDDHKDGGFALAV